VERKIFRDLVARSSVGDFMVSRCLDDRQGLGLGKRPNVQIASSLTRGTEVRSDGEGHQGRAPSGVTGLYQGNLPTRAWELRKGEE